MKVYKNKGHYILELPRKSKAEIAKLMAYRGLQFSTSASSRDKAVLFSSNPYSLCDFAEPDCPDLGPYRDQIEASRALTGKGTKRLPPGKELWEYQKATLDYLLARGGGINGDQPGLGKRQPLDEPVLTIEGWRTIGDLSAGDHVYGANGIPTLVEQVLPIALSETYRVKFSDGRTVRCDPEHLWEVERKGGHRWFTEVKTTQEIMDWGLTHSGGMRNGKLRQCSRFYVPLVEPIEYPTKQFDIHPYVLGVLLGDGGLTSDRVTISTSDKDDEIIGLVQNLIPGFSLRVNRHLACPQYHIVQHNFGKAFHHKITALGLRLKSPECFIPRDYIYGSVQQRKDLLCGLMDTDGSCIKNRTTFHTMSIRLANDVADLVRSLGGWAKVRAYDRVGQAKGVEYQVNVRVRDCPFYLERKAAQWRPTAIKLAIKAIEPCGLTFQRCIKVADPRSLYVTHGYTLTHNTPTSIAFCNEVEAQRILVIVPASLRIQWGEVIKDWSMIPRVKVSVMLNKKDGVHPTAHYQIMSYDAARDPAIIRALSRYRWDVLICDEAHKMKNIEALTTRAIIGNGRGEYHHGDQKMPAITNYCRHELFLTGTPLLNRPSEAFTLLRHVDHEAIDFMGWEKFKEHYNRQADMKSIGGKRFKLESTSLEYELQNRLRVNAMARHEKKDVMTQMKPPRYSVVKMMETGAVKSALDVEGMLGLSIEEIQTTKDFEILGHIAEARRLMGEAIAPQIADYAIDFLEGSEEKLVIFAWHISVLNIFEAGLSKFGTVRVDGSKSPLARQKAVDDFIEKDNVRVFIGNMLAAGSGIDGLQKVCSRCYLAEPDWVPAQNEQAVSRLDRIGQENLVNAEVFVAPGSISEKILLKALEKLNVIHRVLDDKGK